MHGSGRDAPVGQEERHGQQIALESTIGHEQRGVQDVSHEHEAEAQGEQAPWLRVAHLSATDLPERYEDDHIEWGIEHRGDPIPNADV